MASGWPEFIESQLLLPETRGKRYLGLMLKKRVALGVKLGLPKGQAARLARLTTPERVQDFIDAIPVNFEVGGDTCLSVAEALRQRRAHCIESAFIAACAFWINGRPPLLMDLQAKDDTDHVVAVFRHGKCWGAISKSNHVWLRWRDPIYRSLRELAMSYFHEYATGPRKTLATYSIAFDLRRLKPEQWISNKEQCWDVANILDATRHYKLITHAQRKRLRPRDKMEMKANDILVKKAPNRRAHLEY